MILKGVRPNNRGRDRRAFPGARRPFQTDPRPRRRGATARLDLFGRGCRYLPRGAGRAVSEIGQGERFPGHLVAQQRRAAPGDRGAGRGPGSRALRCPIRGALATTVLGVLGRRRATAALPRCGPDTARARWRGGLARGPHRQDLRAARPTRRRRGPGGTSDLEPPRRRERLQRPARVSGSCTTCGLRRDRGSRRRAASAGTVTPASRTDTFPSPSSAGAWTTKSCTGPRSGQACRRATCGWT